MVARRLARDGVNVAPRRSTLEQPGEPPEVSDREYADVVSHLTVSEVLAAVRAGTLDRERVKAVERAGRGRHGILDALR